MSNDSILLLKGDEIVALLKGRERELIDTVAAAYKAHDCGASNCPHSTFIRFPNHEKNRIIALPAYLGGNFKTAGIKWISSFPENLAKGIERASAMMVLNSLDTGRPSAILEGSVISSTRTAASAALAADILRESRPIYSVGLIGCGLINFETLRFLSALRAEIQQVLLYDLDFARAEQFSARCSALSLSPKIANSPQAIFAESDLVCLATTANNPHIEHLECRPETVILHTSLRDLYPRIILNADNVVDDADHVCRAQTSLHLAEQQIGNRAFIRCSMGALLNGVAPEKSPGKISIFSPFGLGILDLAVGHYVQQKAIERGGFSHIDGFFPTSWFERGMTVTPS